MKNHLQWFGILLFTTIVLSSVACGDDGNTTSSGSSSSSGTSGGSSSSGTGTGMGGNGGNGGNGGQGGSGGTENGKATQGTELSSAGDVVKSSKFKMVYNFGGSTPGAGNSESSKHRLHGGLVGVTEGTK